MGYFPKTSFIIQNKRLSTAYPERETYTIIISLCPATCARRAAIHSISVLVRNIISKNSVPEKESDL